MDMVSTSLGVEGGVPGDPNKESCELPELATSMIIRTCTISCMQLGAFNRIIHMNMSHRHMGDLMLQIIRIIDS